MDFHSFRRHLLWRRYFTIEEVRLIDRDFRIPTLTDWQSRWLVENMARGVWAFVDMPGRVGEESLTSLSLLVNPHSYVSLESVFRYHDLIPEEVYITTCVTTQKTQRITTPHGILSYKKIPSRTYIGYEIYTHEWRHYHRATLEKALLDYLWLHKDVSDRVDFEELRWNIFVLKGCDTELLRNWSILYGTIPYLRRVQNLITYIQSL